VTIKVISRSMAVGGRNYEYAPGYLFTSDAACADYDWLVVYDEMETRDVGTLSGGCERLRCPWEHTILATCEPTSIKHYSRAYTRQFRHLLTNRPRSDDPHPGYFLGRGYYNWLTERTPEENRAHVPGPKDRALSVVCSAKRMTHTKHAARYRLICEMARAVPELDWYGHGVRECASKCAVLDPYKYHLALENHIAPHHWSEKVADALLCGCLPFYAGAPDVADDFPAESFVSIPLDDPATAVRIVTEAIRAGEYEKRREAILEAKRLVLEKYNFWEQVVEVVESAGPSPDGPARPQRIYSNKALRRRNLVAALEDGWAHLKGAAARVWPCARAGM